MQGKHRDLRMVIHPTPSQVTPAKKCLRVQQNTMIRANLNHLFLTGWPVAGLMNPHDLVIEPMKMPVVPFFFNLRYNQHAWGFCRWHLGFNFPPSHGGHHSTKRGDSTHSMRCWDAYFKSTRWLLNHPDSKDVTVKNVSSSQVDAEKCITFVECRSGTPGKQQGWNQC